MKNDGNCVKNCVKKLTFRPPPPPIQWVGYFLIYHSMENQVMKVKKTVGQRLVWWGWLMILVPVIALILVFLWKTVVGVIFGILGVSASSWSPLSQISDLLDALLKFIGILSIAWGLSLSPFWVVFLIVGYIKKIREKKKIVWTNTAI